MNWWEWVFSGVGVAFVGWLGKLLYKLFKRYENMDKVRGIPPDEWGAELVRVAPMQPPSSESSQVNISNSHIEGPVAGRDVNIGTLNIAGRTSESVAEEYFDKPAPTEISEAVKKVSMYAQQSIADTYEGLKVRWSGDLQSIRSLAGEVIDVSLSVDKTLIVTKVLISDYPILKTVRGGEPVVVTGTIDYVQTNGPIHLKDAALKFLEAPLGRNAPKEKP